MRAAKIIAAVAVAGTIALVWVGQRDRRAAALEREALAAANDETAVARVHIAKRAETRQILAQAQRGFELFQSQPGAGFSTNKVERLSQIRDAFRAWAQAGDPVGAMRAAKEILDENERETALLALVTEWTKGELRQPGWRAASIAEVGINAALGMELARYPELAKLWAEEMTAGEGRGAIYAQVAKATVASDPATAFAMREEIPDGHRGKFNDEVFQYWARNDTAAALKWAEQLPEAEREAAVKSIRQVAPVGIGAALEVRDEYTVIKDLLPGTPAEVSGLLQPGDKLLAIAQGNDEFIDARRMGLPDVVQMIRGAPNTTVQLRVVNEQAPAGSAPRTVSIVRGQISFGGAAGAGR